MPDVQPGENQNDYMGRCVPKLIAEGRDQDQAVAICASMFEGKSQEEAVKLWEAAQKSGRRNNADDRATIRAIRGKAKEIVQHTMMMEPADTDAQPEPAQAEIPHLGSQTLKAQISIGDVTAIVDNLAIKAVGDWTLEVLGIPFGSPAQKDSDGQYFSPDTNLHLAPGEETPVYYYHGYTPDGKPQTTPEQIGTAKFDHTDNKGHWFRVTLNRLSEYAKRVWEAAKNGVARASSGSIAHLVRIAQDGKILSWPFAELSVFDTDRKRQPANPNAVVNVAKAQFHPNVNQPTGSGAADRPTNHLQEFEMNQEDLIKLLDERDAAKAAAEKAAAEAQLKKEKDELIQLLNDREAAKAAAAKAEAERQAEIQKAVDEATKAAREKWEKESAEGRRLPSPRQTTGAPLIAQYAETAKYDHLSAAELGLMIDMQGNIHAAHPRKMAPVSPNAMLALALKVARIENDKVSEETAGYAKGSLKAALQHDLTDDAIKAATDPNYSTGSNIGSDWVGTAYSNQIWEAIRAATRVVSKIPSETIPDGYSSEYWPLESTDPTWYKVAEVTANDSTMKIPVATVTHSQLATANKQITVGKMGARSMYSGELTEDSLIAWAPQLRKQLEISGAESMEYVVLDGDTSTSSNINDIGGTTYSGVTTTLFLLMDGMRHLPLITNTNQSRSAGGNFVAEDFLSTVKLLGSNGIGYADPTKCSFIVGPNTYFASANLPEAKDKNQTIFDVQGGLVQRAYLVEVIPSWFMHKMSSSRKANSAGKVDNDTVGNNLYGAILAVRWDQWKLAYKRRMTMETTRFANSDSWEITALTRWGLGYRDTTAAAETYYVGV